MPTCPTGALFPLAGILLALLTGSASAATVHRGLGPEPDSLDIHQAQGLAAVNLLRDVREGLVTFDVHGEPAPGQAASWQVLDDGLRYRFTLRADARWSNGDPVTAGDFVRAWRRAFTPATAAATVSLLRPVRNADEVLRGRMAPDALGIRVVDPDTLDIELSHAAPWFPEILAHPVAFPLHADGLDDPRGAPVNGAFLIAEWTPRANIRLAPNPEFHAAGTVAVDGVVYYPIEEPATELARYRAGELDITETIPAGRFAWLQENLAAHLHVHPYLGSFWLGLNLSRPELASSPELRRALALAIDREIVVQKVLGAGELPGWSVVPPGIAGYAPAAMPGSGMSQAEREAEAQRLFRLSGAGRGQPLRLELRYNTSGVHRRMAVAVAAMWKQVLGIDTGLVNEEWKVFVNNRAMGVVTQVFRGGWIADYADPTSFLDLFLSGSDMNHTRYRSEEYDGLMARAGAAAGEPRMAILQQAEAVLMRDMPVIPLYYYVSRHLVRPRVSGYADNLRDIHLSRYLQLETEEF
jgi:oligopeptide transport system substrate-binding protein